MSKFVSVLGIITTVCNLVYANLINANVDKRITFAIYVAGVILTGAGAAVQRVVKLNNRYAAILAMGFGAITALLQLDPSMRAWIPESISTALLIICTVIAALARSVFNWGDWQGDGIAEEPTELERAGEAAMRREAAKDNWRKTLSLALCVSLLLGSMGFTACPKKGSGEVIKPSEFLTAARSFAIFPVVLEGVGRGLDILRDEQDLSAPGYKKAIALIDEVQTQLDSIGSQIESGKFDVESVREKIALLIQLLKDAVNDGTLRIKNVSKQVLFSSIIDYAQVILNNIYLIADHLQPVPAVAPAPESIGIGGVAALTSVLAVTFAEVKQVAGIADIAKLYERARSKSKEFHTNNKRRLE